MLALGSDNPVYKAACGSWGSKTKPWVEKKNIQSFKGKSCCLKFSNIFVGSSEGVKLWIPCKLHKGDLKSSSMSVFKVLLRPKDCEILLYVDLCSDLLWPPGKLLYGLDIYAHHLPTYLWKFQTNVQRENEWKRKGNNHKNNKYSTQKLKCSFLALWTFPA